MSIRTELYNHFHEQAVNGEYKLRELRILIYSLSAVVMMWASTYFILTFMAKPGEIGDSFGVANSLFSALAFAFLIYASLLQTEELKMQRKEIASNNEQLTKSADALKEMVKDRVINISLKLIDDIENAILQPRFNFETEFDEKTKKCENADYLILITNWHFIKRSNNYYVGQINKLFKQVDYYVRYVEKSELTPREISWLLEKGAIQFGYDLMGVINTFKINKATMPRDSSDWSKQFHESVDKFHDGALTTLIYHEIDFGGKSSDLMK